MFHAPNHLAWPPKAPKHPKSHILPQQPIQSAKKQMPGESETWSGTREEGEKQEFESGMRAALSRKRGGRVGSTRKLWFFFLQEFL